MVRLILRISYFCEVTKWLLSLVTMTVDYGGNQMSAMLAYLQRIEGEVLPPPPEKNVQ